MDLYSGRFGSESSWHTITGIDVLVVSKFLTQNIGVHDHGSPTLISELADIFKKLSNSPKAK
jgi:hypothetical protein